MKKLLLLSVLALGLLSCKKEVIEPETKKIKNTKDKIMVPIEWYNVNRDGLPK